MKTILKSDFTLDFVKCMRMKLTFCRLTVTSVTNHPTIDATILKFSSRLEWTGKVAPICWGSFGPLPSSAMLASWAPTSFGQPALPHWATLPLGPCPDGSSPCLGTGPNFEQATMVGHRELIVSSHELCPDGKRGTPGLHLISCHIDRNPTLCYQKGELTNFEQKNFKVLLFGGDHGEST